MSDADATVQIVQYRAELGRHFYELNRAWIEQYFAMEPPDERALLHPEQEILAKGGAIWFALIGDEVVGTCALKPGGDDVYELTKMAVSPAHQRRGIGEQLIAAAVTDFEARSGRLLFLETNAKLGPAMRLYARTGFVRQPHLKPGSEYARSDVYMIYERT